MTQLILFDYQQLDAEARIVVQREDKEFDRNMGDANQSFIEACKNLQRIHAVLKYKRPGFVDYCQSKPGLSQPTAWKMLNVAEMLLESNNIPIKSKEALYLLAAPSTPPEARTEAIERAEAGEKITHKDAKEIKIKHTSEEEVKEIKNSIKTCFVCTNMYDKETFPDACPYCYKEAHNLPSGYIEGLPEMTQGKKYPCPDCGQVFPIDEPCPDCVEDSGDNELINGEAYYKTNGKLPKGGTKSNRAGDIYKPKGYDLCQTPAYAIDPILNHLKKFPVVWEPACGEGYLVDALFDSGYNSDEVISTDIQTGNNFFEWSPDHWDASVTNPPYSIKYQWLERCYQLEKPFALLLPVETLGAQKAQALFIQYGVEIIFMNKRVDFKMPDKGWSGAGAQFPVAWFTWGFEIGKQITFSEIVKK